MSSHGIRNRNTYCTVVCIEPRTVLYCRTPDKYPYTRTQACFSYEKYVFFEFYRYHIADRRDQSAAYMNSLHGTAPQGPTTS